MDFLIKKPEIRNRGHVEPILTYREHNTTTCNTELTEYQ